MNDFVTPLVVIVMGSRSDWPVMSVAAEQLQALGISYETRVMSAHRSPERVRDFAHKIYASGVGPRVIIAGAGGAAHLAGVIAAYAKTTPVLGVPMETKLSGGLDSLLSTVQMPAGVPVPTLAIGKAGAKNAAIFAAMILGVYDAEIRRRVAQMRDAQSDAVPETPED